MKKLSKKQKEKHIRTLIEYAKDQVGLPQEKRDHENSSPLIFKSTINQCTDQEQVKKLVKQLRREYHPDKHQIKGLSKERATDLFKKIAEAVGQLPNEINHVEGISRFALYHLKHQNDLMPDQQNIKIKAVIKEAFRQCMSRDEQIQLDDLLRHKLSRDSLLTSITDKAIQQGYREFVDPNWKKKCRKDTINCLVCALIFVGFPLYMYALFNIKSEDTPSQANTAPSPATDQNNASNITNSTQKIITNETSPSPAQRIRGRGLRLTLLHSLMASSKHSEPYQDSTFPALFTDSNPVPVAMDSMGKPAIFAG